MQVAADGFAGQRVEDDIDALAIGDREDLVGIGQAARIEDVVGAEQGDELALFVAAGGGEDLGAQMARQLDGGDADAAGGAVDQDALARLQVGQLAAMRNTR